MDFAHALRQGGESNQAPGRTWPVALAWLGLAGISLAIGFGAGLSLRPLLVAPLTLLLFGAYRTSRSWREASRRRREADAWIESMAVVPRRCRWRVDELTSAHERRLLAESLRNVVVSLSPNRLPGAVPLDRVALRPSADLLTALADRLADPPRPVSPRGVLAVHHLLTEPTSVLYRQPMPKDYGNGAATDGLSTVGAYEALELDHVEAVARALLTTLDRLEVQG